MLALAALRRNSMAATPYGHLALTFSKKQLPLQVQQSAAGFYLGTRDPEDGSPFSRESVEYWPSRTLANTALSTGNWTQKEYP